MKFVERTIEANGLTHHVLVWNEGARPKVTVVLLHGFLDLSWSFERLATRLATRYHVVAPDFRGHGDSDRVGAGGYYYFPDYTADLARLLPQVAHERVNLVGHSMGGTVATHYAGAYPDKVARLALLEGIGPPAGDPDQAPQRLLQHIQTVDEARARAPRPLPSIDAAAERLRKAHSRLDAGWARLLAERATRPAPDGLPGSRLWKFDRLHRARSPLIFHASQFAAFARRIRCPVLLVNGAESTLRVTRDPERQALYTNRRVVTLPDAGHMLHLDRPDELAQLLLDFFDE